MYTLSCGTAGQPGCGGQELGGRGKSTTRINKQAALPCLGSIARCLGPALASRYPHVRAPSPEGPLRATPERGRLLRRTIIIMRSCATRHARVFERNHGITPSAEHVCACAAGPPTSTATCRPHGGRLEPRRSCRRPPAPSAWRAQAKGRQATREKRRKQPGRMSPHGRAPAQTQTHGQCSTVQCMT